jgi:signal transduction histidine kinase
LHDLNNMFTCILGSLGAAQHCIDDQVEALSCIKTARMATMKSTQLASFLMRIFNGYDSPKENYSIQKLLLNTAKIVQTSISAPIKMQLTERPCIAYINPITIMNAFINLLLNADIAVMNKSESIRVECNYFDEVYSHENDNKSGRILVRIFAEGCGLSQEKPEQVINPGFALNDGDPGLGLNMVRMIIEQHNGALSFISEEGKGTTVMVSLPLVELSDSDFSRMEIGNQPFL